MNFWKGTKVYFSDPVARYSFMRIFGITIAILIATLAFNWRVMRGGTFELHVLLFQIGWMLPVCAILAFFYWRRVVKSAIKEKGDWNSVESMNYHEKNKLFKRLEYEKIR